MATKTSESIQLQVVDLYKNFNISAAEISKRLNLDRHNVGRILKHHKINNKYFLNLTNKQIIEIIKTYQSTNLGFKSLSKKFNISPTSIKNLLIKHKIPLQKSGGPRKYSLDENYFSNINNEIKAYFLGLLYADGYNYKQEGKIVLGLQECDKYILDLLNQDIQSNRPLEYVKPRKKTWHNYYRLNICSKKISNDLTKLGCFQKKSLNLEFPTPEQVPENLLNHFIRGYFDGDGHISNIKNKKLEIVSSYQFNIKLQKVLETKLNINLRIKAHKTPEICLLSSTKTKDILAICEFMYTNHSIFFERKYKRYKDHLKICKK